jgi:hypothetical protein
MPLSDKDFHTPVHHKIFQYLADNYLQFHFSYISPELSPKGFLEVRTVGKYGEKIANVTLSLDDSVSIYFTSIMVSKRIRALLTQALQEAEAAAKSTSPTG